MADEVSAGRGEVVQPPSQTPEQGPLQQVKQEWATTPASHPPNLIPESPAISKPTYSAPMSYIGSTRRITAWIRKVGTTGPTAALAWTVGFFAMLVMWAVVTVWYVVTIFIFGWLLFPFRLIRRSHRKQEHLQRAQLATMQQMMVQQQEAMLQNERQGVAPQPGATPTQPEVPPLPQRQRPEALPPQGGTPPPSGR
jgi:hypothetical protein